MDPKRQAAQDNAIEHLRLLNDQLEIFHAARRIAFTETPTLADLEAIRGLYQAFDTKHASPKGTEQ